MRSLRLLSAALLLVTAGTGSLAYADGDDDDSAAAAVAPAGDDDSAAPPAAAPPPPAAPTQQLAEICDDEKDNDGDGLVDCNDLNDCASFSTCGRIHGGWGWVISSYGISFAALLVYTLVVTLRLRSLQRRGDQ